MFKRNWPKHSNNTATPPKENYSNAVDNTPNSKRPQLIFHCQMAHGSPTGLVHGFSNVRELYQRIAEHFDFPVSEVLFCTLNTYKIDMKKLLGGQIGLEDFIFVHRKGQAKEVEVIKTDDSLGLTITDNGAGYAFIKRIKEGSVIQQAQYIEVGDHIEKLNGQSMVGKRHYEVANALKLLPKGLAFTIRLIEPMKSGFNNIAPKTSVKTGNKPGLGTGRETLRFKPNGKVTIEEKDDVMEVGVEKINTILESFMGINDTDLATQIWDKGEGKTNTMDFAEAIDNSDLEEFGFSDDLIIELWGAITDARAGRLKQ